MFFDTLLFPLPESDTAESNPIFSCVYVNQIANAVTTPAKEARSLKLQLRVANRASYILKIL